LLFKHSLQSLVTMENVKKTIKLFSETLQLSVEDRGKGKAFLILHAGAGPASVAGLAEAISKDARAIVPTHPGFAGQNRPNWFHRIDDLVLAYLALLEQLDVRDVVVVGNSMGGWIAAEMALRHSPRVTAIILLNAAGIDTGSDKKIVNPMDLPPEKRAGLAFHDPKRFSLPQSPEALAMMAANQKAMVTYAGGDSYMYDPSLRARLAEVNVPALVIWGKSDGIFSVDYGDRYAKSIPGSRIEVIPEAGHFPHIEKLDEVLGLIRKFLQSCPTKIVD